jgi:hypothetical protein
MNPQEWPSEDTPFPGEEPDGDDERFRVGRRTGLGGVAGGRLAAHSRTISKTESVVVVRQGSLDLRKRQIRSLWQNRLHAIHLCDTVRHGAGLAGKKVRLLWLRRGFQAKAEMGHLPHKGMPTTFLYR